MSAPASASLRLGAVELFSGLGGFAAAARAEGVDVVAAFDQYDVANRVYETNWGLRPSSRNLESIGGEGIPPADLWWMSPPCTPFTSRGRRRDADDPRAAPFLNMIGLVVEKRPAILLVENVPGFAVSRVRARLLEALDVVGYASLEVELDPTDFGVPMTRRRHFVVASRIGPPALEALRPAPLEPLAAWLDSDPDPSLDVDAGIVARYGVSFHVIDPADPGAVVACTTRGYAKAPLFSGSVLRGPGGALRRLSPREILRLLGFPASYALPAALPMTAAWSLAGNSIDVRAARYLLRSIRVMC